MKTKRFTAKPMDPGEAALQLQLLGHDFYLFTNSETGRAAVLYRRHDGDLGLIETDRLAGAACSRRVHPLRHHDVVASKTTRNWRSSEALEQLDVLGRHRRVGRPRATARPAGSSRCSPSTPQLHVPPRHREVVDLRRGARGGGAGCRSRWSARRRAPGRRPRRAPPARSAASGQIPEWYFTLIGDGPHATVAASDVATTSPTRKRTSPASSTATHAMASTVARMMPTSTSDE